VKSQCHWICISWAWKVVQCQPEGTCDAAIDGKIYIREDQGCNNRPMHRKV
jgi:hypothetical protein